MLMDLTRDAFLATGGVSYARVDIRTNTSDLNSSDFKAYVLEVNGQCSVSFDDCSSMGNILLVNNVKPEEVIDTILRYANV
jgi:hypothetical protein